MPVAAEASHGRQPASSSWQPSKEEQEDKDAIEDAILRMRKITAEDPYVLTIPQDVEPRYHHQNPFQASQWLSGAPFHRAEHENIQYQTYHYHEHGRGLYVLQNSRPHVEEPRVNGLAKGKPAMGANTPNMGPKKKISLDTYKKKQNGAISTPERDALKTADAPAKQPAVKGPVERVKADGEDILASVVDSEGRLAPIPEDDPKSEQRALKRKREEAASKQHGEVKNVGSTTDTWDAAAPKKPTEPLLKKAKTLEKDVPVKKAAATSENSSQVTDKTTDGDSAEETGMPPRLSPGMPPRLSPGMPEKLSPLRTAERSAIPKRAEPMDPKEMDSLPSRLSPTIPDNIAKALELKSLDAKPSDNRTEIRSTPQPSRNPSAPSSVMKDKDGKLTPLKKSDGITKHKSPIPRNGFRANSSSPAVRSDADDKSRMTTSIAKPKSPDLSQNEEIAVGKAVHASQAQKPGKERLLVKMKYKRSRKDAVQWILRFPPKADKSMLSQPTVAPASEETKVRVNPTEKRNGERKDAGPVKGVAQVVQPAEKRKKQKLQQEEKQPVAEKRPPPEDEKFESPAKRKKKMEPSASETRKEPATPAQRVVDSPLAQKTAQQATPGTRKDLMSVAMRREQSQDSAATHNTPPALSSTPIISNSSSQLNGHVRPPSSQPSNKTLKQQAWESEQMRIQALGRELKHAASAHLTASESETTDTLTEQRLAAIKCVESFLCYLVAFTCADEAAAAADPKQAPAYKTWQSLHGFFGFVKRHTGAFGPLGGLACALGMTFSSRVLEIATLFPSDGPSREQILDTNSFLQKVASDAEAKLDIDALQETFPKTWSQRTKKAFPNDKLEPSKLGGQYKLPIGVATTPIRAARAGHAMLQEWIEKEKIDYSLKLKL